MPALKTFTCFPQLPPELRLLVWEFHFQTSSRIHLVHPAPESYGANSDGHILVNCTEVDAGTNIVLSNLQHSSPNSEAYSVASAYPLRNTVHIARDLVGSSLKLQVLLSEFTVPGFTMWQANSRPAQVHWESNLLYMCMPNAEQAFLWLRRTPWNNMIRRLAILVPEGGFLRHSEPPDYRERFNRYTLIREVLETMTFLDEMFLVLVPQCNARANSKIDNLVRDRFGFVPYIDYIKGVRLDSSIVYFVRVCMLFKDVLAKLAKKDIKMERVVDIDRLSPEDGRYQPPEK
ncbi:hypothetical protein F4778DRAFT_748797 [Xylariomycetidae sp. FL2044]|nr:hypothetical protein F4778DRAFT_748797 [Xylariomycetidae sp. FL2044]